VVVSVARRYHGWMREQRERTAIRGRSIFVKPRPDGVKTPWPCIGQHAAPNFVAGRHRRCCGCALSHANNHAILGPSLNEKASRIRFGQRSQRSGRVTPASGQAQHDLRGPAEATRSLLLIAPTRLRSRRLCCCVRRHVWRAVEIQYVLGPACDGGFWLFGWERAGPENIWHRVPYCRRHRSTAR